MKQFKTLLVIRYIGVSNIGFWAFGAAKAIQLESRSLFSIKQRVGLSYWVLLCAEGLFAYKRVAFLAVLIPAGSGKYCLAGRRRLRLLPDWLLFIRSEYVKTHFKNIKIWILKHTSIKPNLRESDIAQFFVWKNVTPIKNAERKDLEIFKF